MDNDYKELVNEKMETDRKLEEHKKLFLIVTGILAVAALWNYFYIRLSIKEFGLTFLSSNYLYICIGALALSALCGILLLCTKYKFEIIWAIVAFMLGALCMRVLPGLSAPDDPIHLTSAYYISNQMMFMEPEDENHQVFIRETDSALFENGFFGSEITVHTYDEAENWKEKHDIKKGMTVSPHKRQATSPIVHLPQAIGITIARLLNLNSDVLVTFARGCNLIAYIVLIYLALTLMPFGKEIMAAVTFIPMAVQLSSSFSYDAMLIALSFLYIAMILNLAYKAEEVTWKDIILLIVVLAILSPCKIVYGILIFLFLLIPKNKFKNNAQYILLWCIAALFMIAGAIYFNRVQLSAYTDHLPNYRIGETDECYSFSYCLHHPLLTLKTIIESVMTDAASYHNTLIGYYVGNESAMTDTPYIIVVFITIILALLGLKKDASDFELKLKDKVVILAVCFVLCGMLIGSMLIGWTPVTSELIIGIQGRYLIPVLPLIIMLLKNDKLKFEKDYSYYFLYFIVSADAFIFIRLFAIACLQA